MEVVLNMMAGCMWPKKFWCTYFDPKTPGLTFFVYSGHSMVALPSNSDHFKGTLMPLPQQIWSSGIFSRHPCPSTIIRPHGGIRVVPFDFHETTSLKSKLADKLLFNFWPHFPASWLRPRPLPVINGGRKLLEMAFRKWITRVTIILLGVTTPISNWFWAHLGTC